MNKKPFYFEIHDLLNQFVAAFDDVVISRYNKDRVEQEKIKVRYIHAPKQRVIYDLNNKAQNLTLPVISININSLSRDESRVFNKITGMYLPTDRGESPLKTSHIRMPVPVNLAVSMSILASYQTDVEQIISNFIPYANPYIVISWKIPKDFNLSYIQEIRTEVTWDGSCALEYPIESSGDKLRFAANTSFTIKGWLFPQADVDPFENIYFVKNNFKTTSSLLMSIEDLVSMENGISSYDPINKILSETEYAHVSGAPTLTNVYKIDNNILTELSGNHITYNESDFLILGKRFKYDCYAILSSVSAIPNKILSSFNYEYYPTVSGYKFSDTDIKIINENTLALKLSSIPINTKYSLILANKIGWDKTESINLDLYNVTI